MHLGCTGAAALRSADGSVWATLLPPPPPPPQPPTTTGTPLEGGAGPAVDSAVGASLVTPHGPAEAEAEEGGSAAEAPPLLVTRGGLHLHWPEPLPLKTVVHPEPAPPPPARTHIAYEEVSAGTII